MNDNLIHRGMGSDLVALCGKMLGISGHNQVRLTYVNDQVTCVECLRAKIKEMERNRDFLRHRNVRTPRDGGTHPVG